MCMRVWHLSKHAKNKHRHSASHRRSVIPQNEALKPNKCTEEAAELLKASAIEAASAEGASRRSATRIPEEASPCITERLCRPIRQACSHDNVAITERKELGLGREREGSAGERKGRKFMITRGETRFLGPEKVRNTRILEHKRGYGSSKKRTKIHKNSMKGAIVG